MKVIIDNGHGINTKGKFSPDKRLYEWKWAREVAQLIQEQLQAQGIEAVRIVTEDTDISLKERCRRANALCDKYGTGNCVLVSVHINAAGADGKWHNATGWSGWVAPNASKNSKRFAQLLYAEAEAAGLQGNRAVPACKYWVGNWAICRDTKCPAVLTENLFQDNEAEVDYLLSAEGKATIAKLHVNAILKYIGK